ncbi:hypothetical protein [Bradyrhizobium sp. BWC-3-1]|uniref:hypothetical protein n=1 Tax=Bradyrhizobium sp. BWC-3-1 TaxID=3080012 RepID=UPI00293F36CF|nr:hypothetical protein [Bradyrhizobium sp. BWC-3-1]WOH58529.1 hypothetical protein RX329_41695 [Bradyrhizobium sp. BWC-3-1]
MISNECLHIPPDHPLAIELYDLIGLQGVIIGRMNEEAALVNAGGDRSTFDKLQCAMPLVNAEVETLLEEYRSERGGDETCRVGLTCDARGYPVVVGRPGGPLLN